MLQWRLLKRLFSEFSISSTKPLPIESRLRVLRAFPQ
jgi:hypothetical protein